MNTTSIMELLQSSVTDEIEQGLGYLQEYNTLACDLQFELLMLKNFSPIKSFKKKAEKLYQKKHQSIEYLFATLSYPNYQKAHYYETVLEDILNNASIYYAKIRDHQACLEAFASLLIVAHQYKQDRDQTNALNEHLLLAQKFIFSQQSIKITIYIDFFNQMSGYFNRLLDTQIETITEMLTQAVEHGFSTCYQQYFNGQVYYSLKRFAQAAPYFKKSAELDANFIQAFCFHALCFEHQGLSEEAISIYRDALAKHPNSEAINNNFAYLLAKLERFEEALPYSSKAVGHYSSIDNQHTYAFILYKLNRRIEYAEKLLLNAHKGGIKIAQLHLAELYHLQKQSRKAKIWFRKFEKQQEDFLNQERDDAEYLIEQIRKISYQVLH